MADARRQQSSNDEHGVDRSLIRWMLSLTPVQRLEFLEQQIEGIEQVRARNGWRSAVAPLN